MFIKISSEEDFTNIITVLVLLKGQDFKICFIPFYSLYLYNRAGNGLNLFDVMTFLYESIVGEIYLATLKLDFLFIDRFYVKSENSCVIKQRV